MHEVALAEAIWREVDAAMEGRKGRVSAIQIVVGAFSGADPESLEFALGLGVKDSTWPKAEIRIRREPLAVRCKPCGREFEPEHLSFRCPACGAQDVAICRGKDLLLESLEVTEDDGDDDTI
jgi:hydrogenase nickel incorporation protein HypA/HybF